MKLYDIKIIIELQFIRGEYKFLEVIEYMKKIDI